MSLAGLTTKVSDALHGRGWMGLIHAVGTSLTLLALSISLYSFEIMGCALTNLALTFSSATARE